MAPIFTGGIIGGELRKKREANRLLREARRKTQKEIWCYKSIFFEDFFPVPAKRSSQKPEQIFFILLRL